MRSLRLSTLAPYLLAGSALVSAGLLAGAHALPFVYGAQHTGVTRLAAVSPTASASAVSASPTANVSPTIDQQQPIYTGGLSVRVSASQTLRAGKDGQVVRVDIPLCSPTKNSDIELTVNGPGTNGPSVPAEIAFRQSYSDCAWYEFDYSQPLVVTAGEALSLTVSSRNHKAALWGYDGRMGDPYPNGAGAWRGIRIDDFAFKVYVQ